MNLVRLHLVNSLDMEYVVGPILALLIGMKFTHYTAEKQKAEITQAIENKAVETMTEVSQQTLKVMVPVAKSITNINNQLGL